MKRCLLRLISVLCLFGALPATAAILYVDLNSINPVSPFSSWATAATTIQDAIDAASSGDEVLVTNGIYQAGGRIIVSSGVTNRVSVTDGLFVQSVNGPAVTIIEGYQPAGVGTVSNAVRCAYLGSNTMLAGFTLAGGQAGTTNDMNGGGVVGIELSSVISNCVVAGNTASNGSGGGIYGGTVFSSTLIGNAAVNGGGAASASLFNCTLTNNTTTSGGGGADTSTLSNCVITGNSTDGEGGGVYRGTIFNCMVVSNSAPTLAGGVYLCAGYNSVLSNNVSGGVGGAQDSTLYNCVVSANQGGVGAGGTYAGTNFNCTIMGNQAQNAGGTASEDYGCLIVSNTASSLGGGAYGGDLYNCVVYGNRATNPSSNAVGGGCSESSLYNCTVVSNYADDTGGGTYGCEVANSIVYYNVATQDPNTDGGMLYCCTTPFPPSSGGGNVTNVPLFVNLAGGDFHQQSNSPTINAGLNASLTITSGFGPAVVLTNDFDGNPRISGGIVDMGAYEFQNPASMISYAWLDQYGLPINTNTDTSDPDGNGMNLYQDWIAGLNPTNPLSVLQMLAPAPTNGLQGVVVTWQSVTDITYYLQRATNLALVHDFQPLASNLVGRAGTTSYTDTNTQTPGAVFYRIGVQRQ